MGINIGGLYIPTSAAELGAATNRDARATAGAIAAPFYNGGAAIGGGVTDFLRGLVTGHAVAQAAPAPVPTKGKTAAPAAPAGPQAPNYTPAYLASQPNFVQQAAAAGKSTPAATSAPAAPAAPPTPLDVIRAAAMNNGGLSLSQLGALSESVARTVPQQVKPVPLTAKEQAASQYLGLANDYAIKTAQDPNYGKSQAGAAHQQLMEDLRGIAATPNQINDVATGMPPLQGN